jgi:hypothetical protein
MLIYYNSSFFTTCNKYTLNSIILDFNYTCNNNIKKSIITARALPSLLAIRSLASRTDPL